MSDNIVHAHIPVCNANDLFRLFFVFPSDVIKEKCSVSNYLSDGRTYDDVFNYRRLNFGYFTDSVHGRKLVGLMHLQKNRLQNW